jgi:hypothetical protein
VVCVESVNTVSARRREVAEWLETDFELGVYARTHDPLPGASEAVEGLLAPGSNGSDPLAEARSDVDDLL